MLGQGSGLSIALPNMPAARQIKAARAALWDPEVPVYRLIEMTNEVKAISSPPVKD